MPPPERLSRLTSSLRPDRRCRASRRPFRQEQRVLRDFPCKRPGGVDALLLRAYIGLEIAPLRFLRFVFGSTTRDNTGGEAG
jgi:hypothetical protein